MPSSNSGIIVGYLAGRYPGRIGHLFGPMDLKGPWEFCPFALDNGAFGAAMTGRAWDEAQWYQLLDRVKLRQSSCLRPRWALVPDVVGDKSGTLEKWARYYPVVQAYGFDAAFAVQDGMAPSDVPHEAAVIFIGGSTEWKWRTMGIWCANFPRVHVGRVNSYRRLWQCHDAGVESCDGTGWFKGDHGSGKPMRALKAYLSESSGEQRRLYQMTLPACLHNSGVDVSLCPVCAQ